MEKRVLAIDIGASNLRVALISQQGRILEKITQKTRKKGKSGEVITGQVLELADFLLKKAPCILGIGISSIGPLDYKNGGIKESPNIPFKFVPLVEPLSSAFGLPILLFNDCLCAVWGEKIYGLGKNFKNLVYITLSTGIGGGAIVDDHLLFGKDGNACEIGHLIIEEKYNFLCSCNKGRGHWEGIASGTNIPRFFKAWLNEKRLKVGFKTKRAKDIFEAAKKKNKIALRFIQELGKINARAISTIISAYDPALITLGGAVALNNKKLILEPLKKYIDHYLRAPKIKITPLGEDITLLGAAAVVFFPPNKKK